MTDTIERQVTFTAEMVAEIHRTRREDGRSFKHQAAALIRDGLASRAIKVIGTINEHDLPHG